MRGMQRSFVNECKRGWAQSGSKLFSNSLVDGSGASYCGHGEVSAAAKGTLQFAKPRTRWLQMFPGVTPLPGFWTTIFLTN